MAGECIRAKVLPSCPTLCDPVDLACQAPPSMGFSRQEHWSGLPCPPPGDLPDPGIEPMSPTSPAWAGRFFTTSATWELGIVKPGLHYLGDKSPYSACLGGKLRARTCWRPSPGLRVEPPALPPDPETLSIPQPQPPSRAPGADLCRPSLTWGCWAGGVA